MQTVTVIALKVYGYELAFMVGNKIIAFIEKSEEFIGKYRGFVGGFPDNGYSFNNLDFPDALTIVSDHIERGFNRLGLNVEFTILY